MMTDILSAAEKNCQVVHLMNPAASVEESVERTVGALQQAFIAGKTKWIVTYSGGKDSTLLTVLAVEIARRRLWWSPKAVHVVYSDTLQEIPQMHNVAMKFLAHIQELSHSGVPVTANVVHPDWSQTFWVLLLGKGYPVPHRRFWWCTERLKVNPVKKVLKELGRGDDVAILTGVRFGEISRRDGKMKRAAPYCVGQGECGQSLEYHGALAPIAHWKTCHIGISLRSMRRLGDGLRWMWSGCTAMHRFVLGAVEKDRALEAVMAKDDAGYLQELARFRKRLMDISNDPSMRVQRPDGKPGKLKAEVRRVLLDELLQLQTKAGIQLICPEEIRIIQELWGDTDGYKNS